jgi:hypothetical protein
MQLSAQNPKSFTSVWPRSIIPVIGSIEVAKLYAVVQIDSSRNCRRSPPSTGGVTNHRTSSFPINGEMTAEPSTPA